MCSASACSVCIVGAFRAGLPPEGLLASAPRPGYSVDFSQKYGNAAFLMNVGIYGLFIVLYYNLIGATFNAVTFGCIFCMLACCCSGSHPGNVWPIMVGYVAASFLGKWACVGEVYTQAINAQAIVVGLCFCKRPFADLRPLWLAVRHPRRYAALHARHERAPCCTAASACITAASRRRSCACSSSRSSSASSARRRSAGWRRQSARQIPIMLTGRPGYPRAALSLVRCRGRRPRRPCCTVVYRMPLKRHAPIASERRSVTAFGSCKDGGIHGERVMPPSLSLRGGQRPTWQSPEGTADLYRLSLNGKRRSMGVAALGERLAGTRFGGIPPTARAL